ncbi:hypothetical protein AB6A40_003962 [Gnathostoma spinigerum]|uniref:Major facilitator superfamily (MFS) profile domain-containing protein n=1 Tax=Gnathostoma spinigerum TaxID=75299 RepID=A0ABD6EB87_9BILA
MSSATDCGKSASYQFVGRGGFPREDANSTSAMVSKNSSQDDSCRTPGLLRTDVAVINHGQVQSQLTPNAERLDPETETEPTPVDSLGSDKFESKNKLLDSEISVECTIAARNAESATACPVSNSSTTTDPNLGNSITNIRAITTTITSTITMTTPLSIAAAITDSTALPVQLSVPVGEHSTGIATPTALADVHSLDEGENDTDTVSQAGARSKQVDGADVKDRPCEVAANFSIGPRTSMVPQPDDNDQIILSSTNNRSTLMKSISDAPHKTSAISRPVLKSALKATKSDAYLISAHKPGTFCRSLSKSDLRQLRKSLSKSDFKQVQDPLYRPRLPIPGRSDDRKTSDRIFHVGAPVPDYKDFGRPVFHSMPSVDSEEADLPSVLFPSMRLLVAALLCCCFITLSISSSNMAVALICMTSCAVHGYGGELAWQSEQEGLVLAAQNAGSLLTIVTGMWADRINGKWMVGCSLVLCGLANVFLPVLARKSFWYAVLARLAVGAADACLMPAANSLITRWFPQTERPAAIGIITGGRQIGTLFILPTAGYLCTRKDIMGGWPSIFYLSGTICALVAFFWVPMGADKPAKQYCISRRERIFIESRIACESIGKRTAPRVVPWRPLLQSSAVWAGIFALVCHEYPLVIMLQFLPNYMRDVLHFAPTKNGIVSAMPIACLFISKTISSSLSTWLTLHTSWSKTRICKVFNATASAGLSLCVAAAPQFNEKTSFLAVIALCSAMLFAGMHTPGVQTALVQLAPPFSGIITGLSFFIVAWFGIGNKILTKWIVQRGSVDEWRSVFYVSAVIAFLPVGVFSIWGSAERQWWSAPSSKTSVYSLNTQETATSH